MANMGSLSQQHKDICTFDDFCGIQLFSSCFIEELKTPQYNERIES
jgi:hypothetical protein